MSDRVWPVAIAAGLCLVILVNLGFLLIALDNPPEIDPTYTMTPSR